MRLFRSKKEEPTQRGRRELFQGLSLEEKRMALDFDEFKWRSILNARKGTGNAFEVKYTKFFEKLSEDEILEAIELARLQRKAMNASETGDHRKALRQFEQIVEIAPFDSVSLMSIGVQYAHLREATKAVEWLEKALQSDPGNERIRTNLESVKRSFGL